MIPPSPAILVGNQALSPDVAVLATSLIIVVTVVVVTFRGMNDCLDDLNRRQIVNVFDKHMWAMIIILGGPLGQAAYWLYGRGPW